MKLSKRKIILIVISTILLLVGLFVSVYALYTTKTERDMAMQTAKPIIVLTSDTSSISLNNENLQAVYPFQVKNFNEESINESNLLYQLEIEKQHNTYIKEIKLVKVTDEGEENIDLINYRTGDFSLKSNAEQIDNYKLYITLAGYKSMSSTEFIENSEDTAYFPQTITNNINIKLLSTQTEPVETV